MIPRRKRRRGKRCRFCGQLFIPDPRLKGRQYACSAANCQVARKKLNQKRWLSRNPNYFRGRYINTRDWLRSHPGYVARYRRENPEKTRRDNSARRRRYLSARYNCADIQVARALQEPVLKILTPVLAGSADADIQDSLMTQVIVTSLFSSIYLRRTGADIQGPIATGAGSGYLLRHEFHRQTPAASGASPEGTTVI